MKKHFVLKMELMILPGISLIFALIGLYLVVRIWLRWKNIDMSVLKARVFLDKKFLEKNWIYIFLSGASLTAHQLIDFLQSLNYFAKTDLNNLSSETFELLALVFLVIIAYEWFAMIFPKK